MNKPLAEKVFDDIYPPGGDRGDKQRDEFKHHWVEQASKGVCPYSGETITRCQAVDLCDCFSFPEGRL